MLVRESMIPFQKRRSRGVRRDRRRGVEAVELALCLPILVAVGFGMNEVCNAVYAKARLQSAAYESVRFATRPTTATNLAATATQVQTNCNTLLTQLGVHGATVSISPNSLANLAPQTQVTVTITAPFSQNSVTSMVLGNSLVLTSSATMIIE